MKITFTKSVVTVLALGLLVSCAHYPDVRPGENGIHRVVILSETKEAGSREAMSQAESYCESKKLSPVYLDEKSKYIGSMSEDDYNKTKTIGKVASAVGSTAYVFGGKKESNAGGIVALGGVAANAATGNGYSFEMKFKCQ